MKPKLLRDGCAALLASLCLFSAFNPAYAQAQKPNIIVIMGDDIGYWNVAAYVGA